MALTTAEPHEVLESRVTPRARVLPFGVAAVCALGVIAFLNSLQGEFVWDDVPLIVKNGTLTEWPGVLRIFATHLWSTSGFPPNYYRPVPLLIYAATRALFGLSPEAFHAVNLAFHVLTCALVVWLLVRILRATNTSDRDRTLQLSALAGGAVFAVHPVHADAVAWISGLMDVSCTAFAVLALALHVQRDDPRFSPASAGTLVAAFLALLCKETAIVVLPMAILYDVVVRKSLVRSASWIWARWAPLALVTGGYLGLRAVALGAGLPVPGGADRDLVRLLGALPLLLGTYLGKLVAPVGLSAVYDLRRLDPSSLAYWMALVALSGGVAVAALVAARSRRFAIAAALIVVPLAPPVYAGLLVSDISRIFGERQLYFCSVGLSLLVAAGMASSARSRSRLGHVVLATALAVVVSGFAAMTIVRNRTWRTEHALWSDTTQKRPQHGRSRLNLGRALLKMGRVNEAAPHLSAAHALDPTLVPELVNLAVIQGTRGRLMDAMALLQTGVQLDPGSAEVHYNLALVMTALGWNDAAIAHYHKVLAAHSTHVESLNNLGNLLRRTGRLTEAVQVFSAALASRPDDPRIRSNLAAVKAELARGSSGGQ